MAESTTTENNNSTDNAESSTDIQFLLGEKRGMTQLFDEEGNVHPVTAIDAGPITVVQIKTKERDGYEAVQVGYKKTKPSRVSSAQQGHMGELGPFKYLCEYRLTSPEEVSVGDTIDVSDFEEGDLVDVSGLSKGKGFQGVVRRHGFSGGPRTHGQKHSERAPGSIGSTGPQRVFKGTKMGGRTGGGRATVQNLKIKGIDTQEGVLYVKGGVPGKRGSLIEIHAARKSS